MKHHWTGKKPDPHKYFGFVYEIENLETGRKYIGKKQYHRWVKNKKGAENDWQQYTGSSKDLNGDIKVLGRDSFSFKILKNFITRGGLTYGEANLQHKRDVLTKALPGGEAGHRAYYNKQIGAIRYVPKEY
jgi:hypothetical protein